MESADSEYFPASDDAFATINDEELQNIVKEVEETFLTLQAENSMFERYFRKLDIKTESQEGILPFHTSLAPIHPDSIGRGIAARKRSKSRTSTIDRLLKLSFEQKCSIAQVEIEDFKNDIERLQEDSEKILDTYRAIIEEAEIRMHEIKKFQNEFERDVVKGSWDARINAHMSEKVVRNIDDRLRQRDTLIDKLRLKNSTLRIQHKKLKMQLRQKEEMGEVLHEVDFEQLKIENTQYLTKIEEKNQELLRLKLMAGKTLVLLNSYKRRLNHLTQQLKRIKAEITQREDMIKRIEGEVKMVDEERTAEEITNEQIRKRLADYRVPAIVDYVEKVAEQNLLKRKEKIYMRKLEIAKMALDRHRKLWASLGRGNPSENDISCQF